MNVTAIGHLENKYVRKMKRLNKEAFPKEERIPFDQLLELSYAAHFDFLAIKDGETFIGFYLIAKNPDSVYVFFFAVTKKQQSKGNGRQILAALKDYYPHQQIILDLEEVDEDTPTAGRRQKKKEFYEGCDFHSTGFELQYAGKIYELLCSKADFDKESFKRLLTDIEPVITALKSEAFEPEIRDKRSQ